MDLTPYRLTYLYDLIDEMIDTEDNAFLFELYKEANRTFSAIMESLITKETESLEIDGKVVDVSEGTGAVLFSLDEFRKKKNQ